MDMCGLLYKSLFLFTFLNVCHLFISRLYRTIQMAQSFLFSISFIVLFTSSFAIAISTGCYREDGNHAATGPLFVCNLQKDPGTGL